MKENNRYLLGGLLSVALLGGCNAENDKAGSALSDAEIENIVRHSYQYVAMYNVNNKFAITHGGWNTVHADTQPSP